MQTKNSRHGCGEGGEKSTIVGAKKRPGAKAPVFICLFAGLKPCAPSEKQQQRLFQQLVKVVPRYRNDWGESGNVFFSGM
jgi:hypothetical protein